MKRNSPAICRCQHRTTSFASNIVTISNNVDDDDEIIRQCDHCGGDLRTQCDGQNDDDHQEFQETSPIAPSSSSSSSSKPHILNRIQTEITSSSSSSKQTTIKLFKFSTNHIVQHYLTPVLKRRPIKVFVLLCYLVLIVISVIGITKVNDGLDLTDIVPHGTNEYRFLGKTRNKIKRYIFKLVKYIRFCYHNEKIGKQQQQQMSCE